MTLREAASAFHGKFVSTPEEIAERLEACRAFIFDWDGVFNNGEKDAGGSSPFSEVDAMGTNLLRFCHFLSTGKVPITAIISGERNAIAHSFARRENFGAVYCGFRDKNVAFTHFLQAHALEPAQVCFFFDDVLDLSLAAICNLRIMVGRGCNPLLLKYAAATGCVDYRTASPGGSGAVREASELLTGLSGLYAGVLSHRIGYSETYQKYLAERAKANTGLFILQDDEVTQTDSL